MPYEQIPYLSGGRELCMTGCAILTASDDLLGKAIRAVTHGDFSHCAPVVRMPAEIMPIERVTLIEALEHGLTATYVSDRFQGFEGHVYLFTPAGLTSRGQGAFRDYMLDNLFSRVAYDYVSLFANLAGHVKEDGHRMFCSEAYDMALRHAGLSRASAYDNDEAPTPVDIPVWWAGRVVELVGPFKKQVTAA